MSQITSAAKQIAAHLDPDKADRDYDEAFEERGAQLSTTFEGNFLLRMWGPAADGELLKAAIKTYTQPYSPENAHQPKHERTYDALMLAMEAAAGHRTCTKATSIQPLCSTHNRLKHRRHVARNRRMWAHHRTGAKTKAGAGAGSDGEPAPPTPA